MDLPYVAQQLRRRIASIDISDGGTYYTDKWSFDPTQKWLNLS